MAIAPGTRLGPYEVGNAIGAGGMGVVYQAFDTRLQRPVAIKVFAGVGADDKAARRLLYEARSASALNHPHVCTIYEVGEANGLPYLVMEFIEGKPLAEMIPHGGLPAETVAKYGSQIAAALAHAHSRGVVHRDLKCLNVMVTPGGYLKVLDFGLAQRELETGADVETQSRLMDTQAEDGGASGTIAYMSPETLRAQPVDRRADIWALGVVIHEMASSQLPFTGDTTFEMCGQILHGAPAALPERVPSPLKAIVLRCLAKDPGHRYQDAAEVGAALDTMQPGISTSAAYSSARSGEARKGLLVLPFTNAANDQESDYFADGLTEEIIGDLSNVRRLRVISRTSSMQLKGTTRTMAELARQMEVDYVLEGSVRRSGAALRISANVVEVAADATIWGQKYNGTLDDVFAIQERLAREIVGALKVVLTTEEEEKLKAHPIPDVRAYELYLRAKQEILKYTKESLQRGIEYLEKAEAIVGENSLILAAKGEAYWQHLNAGLTGETSYLDRAEAAAERAIALDPRAPHGHRLAGLVQVHRGDPAGALPRLRRALEIDPNNTDSLLWAGVLCSLCGQMDMAERWISRLVELDPVTPFYQLMPAAISVIDGNYARAVRLYSSRLAGVYENPLMRLMYAQALLAVGRTGDGRSELEQLAEVVPDNPFGQLAVAFLRALDGDRDAALAALTPGLIASLENDMQYCWHLSQCYSLAGDVDNGLKWLRNAIERGMVHKPLFAERDPMLVNLRSDQRFPELMMEVERRWRDLLPE